MTLSLHHCKNFAKVLLISALTFYHKKKCLSDAVRDHETIGNPRSGRTGYVLVSQGEVGGVWFNIPVAFVFSSGSLMMLKLRRRLKKCPVTNRPARKLIAHAIFLTLLRYLVQSRSSDGHKSAVSNTAAGWNL